LSECFQSIVLVRDSHSEKGSRSANKGQSLFPASYSPRPRTRPYSGERGVRDELTLRRGGSRALRCRSGARTASCQGSGSRPRLRISCTAGVRGGEDMVGIHRGEEENHETHETHEKRDTAARRVEPTEAREPGNGHNKAQKGTKKGPTKEASRERGQSPFGCILLSFFVPFRAFLWPFLARCSALQVAKRSVTLHP
jgi:hypothetical protein